MYFCRLHARSAVSDSLRPHGLQPARLLCPWTSLRVGSLFLLQGIFPTQGLNLSLLHYRKILLLSEPPEMPSVWEQGVNTDCLNLLSLRSWPYIMLPWIVWIKLHEAELPKLCAIAQWMGYGYIDPLRVGRSLQASLPISVSNFFFLPGVLV